ncbi:DUF2970 domain-containing protein [Shewanella sp. NIFS-20-20]|uniref:DUF2970 domain-containing protein n=1 Tax=Shewanella sp. NIFS-20-20 TaxID=2853806 RepID=UPI003529BA6A
MNKHVQAFMSAAAAFLGVQSEQQRQRDFSEQSPLPFIIAGVVLAVIFVASLMAIVSLVLSR